MYLNDVLKDLKSGILHKDFFFKEIHNIYISIGESFPKMYLHSKKYVDIHHHIVKSANVFIQPVSNKPIVT